jgi:hypothetical protein
MATTITYTTSTGREERIELDAAISRSTELSVEVTKFPVETGAVISDHAILAPDRFQLSGMISNTPTIADTRQKDTRRAQDARDRLKDIRQRRVAVTIEANGERHENLVMIALSFPEDGSTGDAVHFSASFERILMATTQVEALPKPPTAPGRGKEKGGKKPTEKASAPVQKKTSTAVDIVD